MINFIVCDDDLKYREKAKDIICKYMMRNSIDYKTTCFSDYNDNLLKIIESKIPNKIYVLDIELPAASGIDIARLIREKDIDSIIIFMTVHAEFGMDLLQDEIMPLTFINKYNNFDKRLSHAIEKGISMIGVKQTICYKYMGDTYQMPIKDIMYIYSEKQARNSIIVTSYGSFPIKVSLNELYKMLGSNLVKTHRICYVNPTYIKEIKSNSIIFSNDKEIDLISSNYRRNLNKYVQ